MPSLVGSEMCIRDSCGISIIENRLTCSHLCESEKMAEQRRESEREGERNGTSSYSMFPGRLSGLLISPVSVCQTDSQFVMTVYLSISHLLRLCSFLIWWVEWCEWLSACTASDWWDSGWARCRCSAPWGGTSPCWGTRPCPDPGNCGSSAGKRKRRKKEKRKIMSSIFWGGIARGMIYGTYHT